MKRFLPLLALLVLVLLAAYSAARFYTGQTLSQAVDNLAQELAAEPEIEVLTLAYQPGIFHGELEYDLRVRAPAGHPLLDTARILGAGNLPRWLNLRGTAAVSQGPHPSADGLILAWARQSWPGLELQAGLRPDGMILGTLTGAAYQGDITGPDELPLQVDLSPWEGSLRWQPDTQRLDLALTLQHLLVDQAGFQGEVREAVADLELTVMTGDQWQSRTQFQADRLELASDVSGTRLDGVQLLALAERAGDRIENRLEVDIGPSLVEDIDWQSLELRLALSGLDAEAYMTLLEELAIATEARQFGPQRQQNLIRALEQLVAAGPTVNLERLALRLFEDSASDDLAAALRLQHDGGDRIDLYAPARLLEQSQVRLHLLATRGALLRISQWRAEADARRLAIERDILRTEEQIQRAASSYYRNTLLTLQFMPLVTMADGKAETHLELRDGAVYRNDERLMPVAEVVRMLGL
ncbi:DUF945 family protein [Natronospirillum operosum]|uniref:DUF945 family protein n=1 Tax=Natronospirillum operosum TaxID=2759953 RepID=A0A4Z0WJX9_9GAMM|nr:DUF945 family protein [Natronospirillum operosum]TGG95883.1 DUF945 family protein [Natronospirillum operosum]